MISQETLKTLNDFRNMYYRDGNATENGRVANAINDILPLITKIYREVKQ